MVGACIGFVGIIGVRVLVLGDSFDGLHSKFAETGMLETVGVSLLAILILLFSIFLQVLLHEGGHLVCGLATGYRFVSFRIFNLTFIRKDGKLCIKRFSLAGTGGQCLLTPPERPLEDIPTTLYNLGGVLANLLTAILAFLPLLTVDGLPYLLKFFLLMLSLIGILLAGMNGIPMKMGGIGNDADNMRLLLKDSKSKGDLRSHLPTEKQILDAGRSQFGHSLDEINPYRQECLVRWNDISFTCYICCLAAHYAVVAENKRQSRHKTQIRRPPSRTPTP